MESENPDLLRVRKASRYAGLITFVGMILIVAGLSYAAIHLRQKSDALARTNAELNQKIQTLTEVQISLDAADQLTNKCGEVFKAIPATEFNKLAAANPTIKEIATELKNATNTNITKPVLSPPQVSVTKDLQSAQAKEREGFQALIDGRYDHAIAAFQASENAYNTYHNVYEIARIIRLNKSKMQSDPAIKRQVFQTIVQKYGYGAPADMWAKVVAIANNNSQSD